MSSRQEALYLQLAQLQFITDTKAPDQLDDPKDYVIPMKKTRRSAKEVATYALDVAG